MRIILASQSPRRRELLERMGVAEFDIIPAQGEEVMDPSLSPDRLVEELSRQKCAEVAAAHPDGLVIAADTVVSVGGLVLGKPHSEAEAASMLRLLSGRDHQVMTGCTILYGDRVETFTEVTSLHFRPLSEKEIQKYVQSGEPMDKAGAYGIQGGAALFCEKLEGDYYNVMGLPVCRLYETLCRTAPEVMEDTL